MSRESVVAHQRRRILDALAEAFGEVGYQQTTVERVVARAGVSRKTFYEIHGGRPDWFVVLCDRIATDLLARVDAALAGAPAAERPHALAGALVGFCAERPRDARICFVESLAAGDAARAWRAGLIARLSERIAGDGPDLAARAAVGAAVELTAEGTVRAAPGAATDLVACLLARGDLGEPHR